MVKIGDKKCIVKFQLKSHQQNYHKVNESSAQLDMPYMYRHNKSAAHGRDLA